MSPNNSTIYPHATWKSTSFSLHLTQFLAKKTKKIAVIKKKNRCSLSSSTSGHGWRGKTPADTGFSAGRTLAFPLAHPISFPPIGLPFPEQFTTSYLVPEIWRADYHAENMHSAR